MTVWTGNRPALAARAFDRIEQAVVVILYALLVARIWPEDFSASHWASLLLLFSEGAVLVFLLIRQSTDRISLRASDWLFAAAGTFLPLLVAADGNSISPTIGAGLLLVGTIIHIGAKLSLNRSFGLVAANRGVKQNGLYRFVRHPMYAGYMMTHIGYLLSQASPRNLAVYALLWTFLLLRIHAEERVLSEDPAYRSFADRVRFRLLPGVY
jgi:protein-S-isoprenylcysteine O-methyltransferase Ste14